MNEKALVAVLCLLGIAGVCYGLYKRDHVVFFAGLVFLIAGYLLFRKKLRAYYSEKYFSQGDPNGP